MSWKYVFNSHLKMWFDIGVAFKMSKECGYDYFVFNDIVYNNELDFPRQTNYKIEDLY